jgi:AAA15 family ATPase/GTPase
MRLEELHFKNYRLFQELKITGLKRVNLIAGKNNTGKTALLEGICQVHGFAFPEKDWF